MVPQGRRLFTAANEHPEMAACLGKGVKKPTWACERFRIGGTVNASFQDSVRRRTVPVGDSRVVPANPEVILMDEPTEGLSPIIVEEASGKIIRNL